MWFGTIGKGPGEAGGGTARAWAGRVPHAPPRPHTRLPLVRRVEEDKSHIWKDPIHEESHDSSTEQPSHGDSHKPGHKDVPEEAPVHGLPGADPAHGHHRAHLWEHRHFTVKMEARKYEAETQTLHSADGNWLISEVNCIMK